MKQKKTSPSDITASTKPTAKWIYLIIAVHITLALVYWYMMPFGAPPDEGPHGKYIGFLAENMQFPVFDANDRTNYEFHQPPLYYVLGTPFYLVGKTAGLHDLDSMARLLSILLGAVSIYLIYLSLQMVFNDFRISLACTGFAAFLPTHVMLSSSVSNDILTELVYSAAFLLFIIQIKENLTWRRTILTGLLLGAGILTKTTCLILFPLYGILILLLLIQKRDSFKVCLMHFAVASGIGLLIGGGWLVRNTMLYGDPFGLKLFQTAFEHTAKPEFFLNQGLSMFQYFEMVIAWTFASFWGVFGHMKIFMPSWIYILLGVLSIPFAVISLIYWIKMMKSDANQKLVFALAISLLVIVMLSFVRFNLSFFQAQGRYLYPALIPFTILFCLGISKRVSPYVIYGIMFVVQIVAITAMKVM
ncbi:MAG: glycosyltransferase family 39 protein [Armatimonadota bacterium]